MLWTVVLENTFRESRGVREIQPVHPKGNQSQIFIGRTDTKAEAPVLFTWCEELTHWKRPWCWERLKVSGLGGHRGWDGWMASLTQWTWVWVNFGSWWWTGNPGMLLSMGSQRAGYDWVTEVNWDSHRINSGRDDVVIEVLQIETGWKKWLETKNTERYMSKLWDKLCSQINVSVLPKLCSAAWLWKTSNQEGRVDRNDTCIIHKSQQSGEKIEWCPKTNSRDSTQPGQFLKG